MRGLHQRVWGAFMLRRTCSVHRSPAMVWPHAWWHVMVWGHGPAMALAMQWLSGSGGRELLASSDSLGARHAVRKVAGRQQEGAACTAHEALVWGAMVWGSSAWCVVGRVRSLRCLSVHVAWWTWAGRVEVKGVSCRGAPHVSAGPVEVATSLLLRAAAAIHTSHHPCCCMRRYSGTLARVEVRDQFLVRAQYALGCLVSALSCGLKVCVPVCACACCSMMG